MFLRFDAQPILEVLETPDLWATARSLRWTSPELDLTIPAGFVTDLASIPTVLRNVLDVDGRSRAPAVLHDFLYTWQGTTRAFADEMLRLALIAYRESAWGARVYWLGVRAGGWKPWNARLGKGLTVEHFVSADAYRVAITSLSSNPPLVHYR